MRRSSSASGKSRCRNRQRRLSASDSSRVEFEVSSANGRRVAVIVPSSGTVTWKSLSTSSSRPSTSTSALSISSTSSTVGSVRRIAVSSGRGSRNSSENTSSRVSAQDSCALTRGDPQQLLGVVPLVERAGLVDALVALQPDQPRAGGLGDRLGQLGLADPGRPLDQQRLAQPIGQEDGGGDGGGGQVADAGQPVGHLGDRAEQRGLEGAHPAILPWPPDGRATGAGCGQLRGCARNCRGPGPPWGRDQYRAPVRRRTAGDPPAPSPVPTALRERAEAVLAELAGPGARLRDDQWTAVARAGRSGAPGRWSCSAPAGASRRSTSWPPRCCGPPGPARR